MRLLVGWTLKLSLVGVVYLVFWSLLKKKLPEEVLGYKVPPSAQEWVDRNANIAAFGKQTQAGFKSIGDQLK